MKLLQLTLSPVFWVGLVVFGLYLFGIELWPVVLAVGLVYTIINMLSVATQMAVCHKRNLYWVV